MRNQNQNENPLNVLTYPVKDKRKKRDVERKQKKTLHIQGK